MIFELRTQIIDVENPAKTSWNGEDMIIITGIPWNQAFYETGVRAKNRWKLILGKWSNQQI